ncbi:MAG: hypothetical protein ABIE14_02280 [Patescibacteria group bacterium]
MASSITLPYAEFKDIEGNVFHKPHIQGVLSFGSFRIPTQMLVDSGADCCLIPHGYGVALGLKKPQSSEIEKTNGIGGATDFVRRKLKVDFNFHNRHKFGFEVEFHWLIKMDAR